MSTSTFNVHVSPTSVAHVYQGADVYCSVHHMFAGGVSEAEDRAKQISVVLSAAPELLATLKELEAQMLLWTDSDLNGLMPRVRAAIVKAEGGAA